MRRCKVGIIGCGGRGHRHAQGYMGFPDVELVACADPDSEACRALADEYEISKTYRCYKDLLQEGGLDVISICTWPKFHKDIVVCAVHSGIQGILCEKPMALTWGDSKVLYQSCVDNDVAISLCHQRRFGAWFVKAKELANDGTIGQLRRVEGACANLFDWGTHWFDMFFFYNNQEPAQWVFGQIDMSEERRVFGALVETGGVSWVRWENEVEGFLTTGVAAANHIANRLIGSDGMIELGGRNAPAIRVSSSRSGAWYVPSLDGVMPETAEKTLPMQDIIDAVKTGREPELSGRNALQATELIFATYESSRRRAKIMLPLDANDSALLTMHEKGMLG